MDVHDIVYEIMVHSDPHTSYILSRVNKFMYNIFTYHIPLWNHYLTNLLGINFDNTVYPIHKDVFERYYMINKFIAKTYSRSNCVTLYEDQNLEMSEISRMIGKNMYQLTYLPKELKYLVNLQRLDVSRNQLEGLPSEIKYLVNLRELDLSHNQFQNFPRTICEMTRLQSINIGNNDLFCLPEKIGYLANLSRLEAYCNRITRCPLRLDKLSCLAYLDVSFNQIKTLSHDLLRSLTNLTHLDVSFNQIKKLSHDLSQSLPNLRHINMGYNPIQYPPQ